MILLQSMSKRELQRSYSTVDLFVILDFFEGWAFANCMCMPYNQSKRILSAHRLLSILRDSLLILLSNSTDNSGKGGNKGNSTGLRLPIQLQSALSKTPSSFCVRSCLLI